MNEYSVELGGMKNKFFTRNYFIKKDSNYKKNVIDFIIDRKNTDIYKSIYEYSDLDFESCKLYAPFYIDLDMDMIDNESRYNKLKKDLLIVYAYLTNILKIPKESIGIYFSGHKGYHIIIPPEVIGIKPCTNLNILYKKVALEIKNNTLYDTVDTKIYDNRRLLRITNSIHSKTNLHKVPVSIGAVRTMNYSNLQEYASSPKLNKKISSKYNAEACVEFKKIIEKKEKQRIRTNTCTVVKTDKLLPCVVNTLANGVTKGMRNEASVAIASALLQTGKDKDNVLDILFEWNLLNDPPLNENEIYATVNSAYNMLLNDKGYGCNAFKTLDLCIDDCEIKQKGDK